MSKSFQLTVPSVDVNGNPVSVEDITFVARPAGSTGGFGVVKVFTSPFTQPFVIPDADFGEGDWEVQAIARGNGLNSAPSNTVTITVAPAPAAPVAITDLEVVV